jgi:hypothetical protein
MGHSHFHCQNCAVIEHLKRLIHSRVMKFKPTMTGKIQLNMQFQNVMRLTKHHSVVEIDLLVVKII